MPETNLTDLSSAELPDALAAIIGGDDAADRYASDIRRAVTGVNLASRQALAEAARLHADDEMNPTGRARLLSELPGSLRNSTTERLDEAEMALDIIEGVHLAAILRHDGRDDPNRRAELANYVAGIKPETAVASLVGLAANPRYSTYLAGFMGESLAGRFGFDSAALRSAAIKALAIDGTPEQVRRSAAMAAVPAARRAIQLARGGRDNAASESQRAPKRAPSTALMS